jgi:hypothetical protein
MPPVRRGTTPAAGDLDGDGDVDVILGTAAGGLSLFLNTTVPHAREPPPQRSGMRLDTIPNPSRDAVTFRVSGADALTELTVVVSDAAGRLVARLPVAADAVSWNGRGGRAPAPAGVYVARVEAAGVVVASATFTLVR